MLAGTYRVALVGALTVLLVGATAPPSNNTTIMTLPPPTPGAVKLSDKITFRGKTCSLVSAADDADSSRLEARGASMRCVISYSPNVMFVSVPGDPDETITFRYAFGLTRSAITGSGTEDSRSGGGNTVTITGTVGGVLGTASGFGTINVFEPVRSP